MSMSALAWFQTPTYKYGAVLCTVQPTGGAISRLSVVAVAACLMANFGM